MNSTRNNNNEQMQQINVDMYGVCCCCLELCSFKTMWAEYAWMGRTEVYGDMLEKCFNLSWPRYRSKDRICEVCITQLRNALLFRERVLESQLCLKVKELEAVNSDIAKEKLDDSQHCNGDICDDDDCSGEFRDTPTAELDTDNKEHLVDNCGDDFSYNDSSVDLEPKRKSKKSAPTKRNLKYLKSRQNASLILEHSTILPFKSNKGYFNCFYCNIQYVSFDQLRTHVSDNHRDINFKTISKSILRPHDKIRADVSDITCKLCKNNIENINKLIDHLTVIHSIRFNYSDKDKPEDCILPYELGDGKFKCCQCKNEFLFFKTLSKHMNEHSTDYVCDVCGRCFLLPERLRAHSQTHAAGQTVKCEYCDKVCASNILLRSHIRYTHKKLSFLCSICDKTFPNVRLRMKHLQDVHNRTPLNLNCKLCAKKFTSSNSLNSHTRYEHKNIVKEFKFGCPICGMMFKSKYSLSCHGTVHSGEKNFECDVCHKRYARSKALVEHMKIHFNDKRWSCGLCLQSFVQKCSLKNHIRVHHVECNIEDLIVYKKSDDN